MKFIVTLLLSAAAILATKTEHCEPLRFTGNTRADITLIKDALRNVQLIAQAKFACQSIEAVEAEVLPTDYKPSGSPYPDAEAKSQYES